MDKIILISLITTFIICQDTTTTTDTTIDTNTDFTNSDFINSDSVKDNNDPEKERLKKCLSLNDGHTDGKNPNSGLTFSECINNNDKEKTNKLDYEYIYCCYLKIYKGNDDRERYCITANKSNQDSLEERVEMFKLLNKSITKVTIDCSSNYLYLSIIFLIFILF